MVKTLFWVMLTLMVLALAYPAAAIIKYKAVPLPGGTATVAHGLNNAGQVVGITGFGYDSHAFRYTYSTGVMEDLGTLWGGEGRSEAWGINASGQVVGNAERYLGGGQWETKAFLYSNGVMQDLTSPGEGGGKAYAINNAGEVAGGTSLWNDEGGYWYGCGFFLSGGVKYYLPAFGFDWMGSEARALNNAGQVVGTAQNEGNYARAFLYSDGIMLNLETLGNWGNSWGTGINDAGQVVGATNVATAVGAHAFLYSGGVMQDLGILGGVNLASSVANGINNAGQVVGESDTEEEWGARHAFLYSGGVMRDLNNLVKNLHPEEILHAAKAINDKGWIIARGAQDYLLIPVTPSLSPILLLLLDD
jgi:probable HAF family extracellular repeat protein